MLFLEILAIIFLAIFIGSIFYFGFRTSGPWGSFWSFLLVIFFGMWVADIWVEPYGPIYWGVAWIDMLFVGLLLAFILAAASPRRRLPRRGKELSESEMLEAARAEAGGVAAFGVFFWLMLIMFITIGIIGLIA